MRVRCPIEIVGAGASVPARVVTNDDFARRLDTSDEWIVQRTGIRERRFAATGESTLGFAAGACKAALQNARVEPAEIDLLISATITPDHTLPSLACELQAALGLRCVPAFDLVAACSGFVYGLITAGQFIQTGMARTVLVVGAECMTRTVDMEDRSTCVLFGDGSAAAVVRRSAHPERGVVAARWGADGTRADLIWIPAGGSAEPASIRTINERLHFMRMKGREVYKVAVTLMQDIVRDTCADAGIAPSDLELLIPHQSNLRIIESACSKLGIPSERVMVNIDRYGNTSAASVPLALVEARGAGRLTPGSLIMLVAFGAGFTWASVVMRV
jgi:3-oxoacyl-[acyl-carrier-protein] synthase-3